MPELQVRSEHGYFYLHQPRLGGSPAQRDAVQPGSLNGCEPPMGGSLMLPRILRVPWKWGRVTSAFPMMSVAGLSL